MIAKEYIFHISREERERERAQVFCPSHPL